jgi:hypothetical protein
MGINNQTRAADDGAQSVRADQFRANHRALPLRLANFAQPAGPLALLLALLAFAAPALHAQSTYQITSATYGSSGLAVVPAGVNGATLTLTGTLPTVAQQAASPLLGCFYTGYGSTTGFALSPPSSQTTEPLNVPASTIQSIPQSQFTAANGYSVVALVYFIASGSVCDGTFNASLTNQFAVQVAAPYLGSYTGPTSVPQTNPSTSLQAAPLSLNIPAGGFLPSSTQGGATTVTFGSFGSVSLSIPATATSSINVPVPAAFSSSPVGTAASLTICNTFTGAANPVCTTPTPPITLTVTALAASAGTITATPSPVLTSGTTVLTAQFKKAAGAGTAVNLGAPSGAVTFTADGATVAPAPLVLDTTAAFASQTTTLTAPAAPAPVMSPAAGAYTGATTITITDAVTGAAIYYTQDGTTPTASSTLYTGPFQITASETVNAIAVVPGYLNSPAASNTYTITILPATQLAFTVQPPSSVVLNTPISPAVQVALKDVNGTTVVNSTAAVNLSLYSDPGDTSLGGTTTVNAVNGIATFSNITVGALGNGYSLQAHSGNLVPATSQPFNVTPPSITMTVQSELVGINSTLNGSFTLGAPAPAGGLVVTLTSGTPANVTISPASVTVPAGQTSGAFTYTGVAAGNSTLSAAAPSYTTGTVMTTATSAQVSLGMIPNVAPAQMQSIALSLVTAAPAGGTTVTFTIANPNIASVTASSFVPAGSFTPAENPQVTGILIGTTTVTANAPGYAPATRPVVVTVTAAFNPGNTDINLATATNTSLTISAPAPPGGIAFTLSSDDPTIATVPSTVTVPAGATSIPIAITGVANGSTTIRADSPGIAEATGTVNVASNIGTSNFTTGYSLEEDTSLYLPVAPSAPTTVTVTVADPTVAVVSTSDSIAGQATLTFPNTTSNYIGTIAVQGLKVGTTTIAISAPGYTAGTIALTVNPSGFVIDSQQLAFQTTTYSSPSTLTVYPALLNSDLSYNVTSTLIPQSPTISIAVTSSSPAIGTVTSPLTFQPTSTQQTFTFTPAAVGTTNLTLGAPPTGFSVSTSYQQSVATVVTPTITVGDNTTGVFLQNSSGIYLPEPPPSAVTVTVTSGTPGVVTLSQSETTAGTATQTFNVAAGSTYVGNVYLQGQTAGTSTLTVSAPGYNSGTSTITVLQSGFAYYYYYYGTTFATTTFSQPTSLSVFTATLNSDLSVQTEGLPLNPGVGPVNVPIVNSSTSTGTVSPASLVFNAGDTAHAFTFTPAAAGMANLTIGTPPAGFSTPTNYQQETATVTAPAFGPVNVTTGVNLQQSAYIGPPVSSPSPETITVTSSNPAVATLSTSQTTAGTATVTFTTTSGSGMNILVQGQSAGTSTITVSAPGYTASTGTITVLPSGFVMYYGAPPFTTTTFSSQSSISVYTATLSNGSLNLQGIGLPLNPGVTATVAITDSMPSVGSISPATLVFSNNDTNHSYTFQPISAGTTTLSLSTPVGFSTPANYQSGVVTVTAPVITIGNVTTGVNLQASGSIYLPQTPPSNNGNGVTVTVTSSSPSLATLSTSPNVPGTASVVFTNVTSTNVGIIYIQGQGLGTAQLTETAPGYTDGSSTITVDPSGFAYYGNPDDTLNGPGGNPSNEGVYACVLNPGTLTIAGFDYGINPGLGSITVPITSANPSVASVPASVVFGTGVGYMTVAVQPVAAGTTTINLGTPAGFSTPSQYTSATVTVP